jgi:DNA-binding transcriptional regulator YdaS (Cro superfamily)
MSRPTIDYLNARRASRPANGGKVYSREVRYAEDDGIRVLRRLSDNGLRTAIETVGGVRALASLLGLIPQTIYQWRRVPAKMIVRIEEATGVPREVMRPEFYEGWKRQAPSKPDWRTKVQLHEAEDLLHRATALITKLEAEVKRLRSEKQFLEMAAKGEVKAQPIPASRIFPNGCAHE